MTDIDQKFYAVPSPAPYVTLRSRSQTSNFYVKSFSLKFIGPHFFQTLWCIWFDDRCLIFAVLVFAKLLMDLIHVWHGDRNLSKILRGSISTPRTWPLGQGHRLRIFMFNFYSVRFWKAFDGFDSCFAWIDIDYKMLQKGKVHFWVSCPVR